MGLPGTIAFAVWARRKRIRGSRFAFWLPALNALFLVLWGMFIRQVFFLDEPLVLSARAGILADVRLLLEQGASPNARWEDGQSALDFAKENHDGAMIKLLRSAGAKD